MVIDLPGLCHCVIFAISVFILFLLFRITRNNTIAARDRLTIYFHAVLSKDFKFDPKEDRVFIRAGSRIGKWEENTVELSATRYLFLNELSELRWWFTLWAHPTMIHS